MEASRSTGEAGSAPPSSRDGPTLGPGLSLVIPAWNEVERLDATLRRYVPALDAAGVPYEVIVVAEGSTDRTEAVVAAWGSRRVRVLRPDARLGKGGAVVAGIQAAEYERVGFLDADGPIPPSDLLEMFRGLERVDCVVASRWLPESRVLTPQPLSRRVCSRAWNVLVQSTLGLPLHDTQCGAKVFRRSSVALALPDMVVTNWAFDVDLLFQLRRRGRTIEEHPVTWSDDADSRLAVGRAVPAMVLGLLAVRLRRYAIVRHLPQTWRAWYHDRWVAG